MRNGETDGGEKEGPETPSQYSDIGDIFGKENSAVTPSRVARFEDICSSLLCVLALASLVLRISSRPHRRFFSVYSPGRVFISLLDRLPTPFAKGTSGAWSILLMVRTRVYPVAELVSSKEDPLLSRRRTTVNAMRLGDKHVLQAGH